MGIYTYNEEKFNESLEKHSKIYSFSENVKKFFTEIAKNHRDYWDDNLRQFFNELDKKYENERFFIVNASKSYTPIEWTHFILFIEEFAYQGYLWGELMEVATEEQKEAYFGL